ncbi:immune inhibitor A domain-containing protein [Rhizohabitans arisaemae]|uniref:immune inhibitor A domain-containing protein n=1 Tax=Rhizohabitans arisaemae TaxID=2720610 RepID=UPI0024B25F3E|nr:immune inhibitor A domain-containing protein [Rhizohabitans arisaemae]
MPVLALGMTGLTATTPSASADNGPADWRPAKSDHYINYTAPQIQPDVTRGSEKADSAQARSLARAHQIDRKYKTGNPAAARVLTQREQRAIRTGQNPIDWLYKKSKTQQKAKLLTLLVEFNENANDDFSGYSRPRSIDNTSDCEVLPPGTLVNGPLHNRIPNPALTGRDNNTPWVADFSPDHYNKMLYTKTGITQRIRTDLTGPDGRPGISLAGYTMKNMFEEMSKGAYTVDGKAIGWIKVPHSEAWYGAGRCGAPMQDMQGHPDNPLGAAALPVDAVNALAAAQPNFPWADYDIEDTSDADGDGNTLEPDGVIDHVVLVHAGIGKSTGGGAEGTFAIWAHSSAVAGGYQIPGTNKRISNYIVQPENAGVGVFAHEYGHDLGLPDLYDTSGNGQSNIEFWDLMSSGSHSGPIFQSMPTHMGLWDKWTLGWADPKIFNPGDAAKLVTVGQTSRTPKFTEDGIRINLPDKRIVRATPHSGSRMWWSNSDQDWADVRLARDVTVPAGTDVKFWMWSNYVIEAEWDYGFVEVSTDGGTTWNELKVYNEAGVLVSTDDGDPDPNGRLRDYGNKKYGLTNTTGGWRHDYVNLTPYAGQSVKLRLRYATDAATLEQGWFADDFSVTNGGTTVWSDDVEGGANGWAATVGTFTDTGGAGWAIDTGIQNTAQYYLAEWRNFDGFDEGLKWAYDTNYQRDGAWKVERFKYNAPGLLVWYRDAAYAVNHVVANQFAAPSIGSKGTLLIVDSHFEPLRRTGVAAEKDTSVLKNLAARPQASNSAFTFGQTHPMRECLEAPGEPFSEYCTDFGRLPAVKEFTDAKTWYPGLESRPDGLYYRFRDASVVIPAKGNQDYSTRIVNPDGSPATELYGQVVGGHVLGSGNPGDEGKAWGVKIKLITPFLANQGVVVHVTPPLAN